MNKEKDIMPELRFPEFKNEEEWQKIKIEEIAKVSAGGTPESTNPEYWNGNIPWMNSGELNKKRIYSVSNYITSKGLKESSTKLIPANCVLIGLAGQGKTRGTAAINYIELCTNQSIGSIYPNKDVFDSEFLYQKVDSMYEKLRSLSTGEGGRGGLNLQIIKEIELLLPKLNEQKKIASCLSSLDEVIAAHRQKLELLKENKKGLMQNLFPQEGKSVPKYRFKGFENDGKWVKSELRDFCFNISSGKDKIDEGGEFDLYGSTGIIGKTQSPSHTGNYILVARVGANAGLLNKASGSFGVTDNTLVIDLKKVDLIDFIYYSLKKNGLNKLVFGSGQPLITGGQLKRLMLFTPQSEKEQQNIASCLSALDELIAAQADKIEQLKLHKKGLMQGLFPKTND